MTLTICFLAIKGVAIPELLGSALTAVLGFYFGTKIGGSRTDKIKEGKAGDEQPH